MATTLVIKGADFSTNKIETVQIGDPVPCTGISLDHDTLSMITIGGTSSLTPTVTPANTTDSVSWASNNTSVATVANGVVTAVSLGTATITATCGSQSATCVVIVDNVVPDYVAICGYSPYKRTSTGNALTSGKNTSSEKAATFIIAKNQASGLYPIESKSDVDTSPYRFVPIMIPVGATAIKISCDIYNFYTRTAWIDSTKKETIVNTGAYCVQGMIESDKDQNSSVSGSYTETIPTNVEGLDSVCVAVLLGGGSTYAQDKWLDYSEHIKIEFLIEE